MPTLSERIESDLITALKAHDSTRVSVLRLLKNSLKNAQIANNGELTDEIETQVLRKQAKDRQETITLYEKAGKLDAAKPEQAELAILKEYLPQEMPEAELQKEIDQAFEQIKPQGPADFGKIMGYLMPQLKGKVDGSRLSGLITKKLNNS